MSTVDGRATKQRSTFRMECGVAVNVAAKPEKIWALLTDAPAFPKWNSTVTSIDGRIALGEKIRLRVPLAPKRVFKLEVSAFEPIAGSLPDFAPAFEQYAADLKRAAESA